MRQFARVLAPLAMLLASCAAEPGLDPASIGIEMVSVPAGEFMMGAEDSLGETDEQPVHLVRVSSFEISATEITQAQYERIMGKNPSFYEGSPHLPLESVSWREAALFCNTLSDSAGLDPCYDTGAWTCDFSRNGFRLPTEAEWEYAARAGTRTRYFTGDSVSTLGSAAWYRANSRGRTQPVGSKAPNPFGLYDIHGNVFEWCNDWYDKNYYAQSPLADPRGPADGALRVRRDGGAIFDHSYCRSANRGADRPDANIKFAGFRVVRSKQAAAE